MKLVKAIIRTSKLDAVTEALTAAGVQGMTVISVHGFGRQKGHKTVYRGQEYTVHLLEKKLVELVVSDDLVPKVVDTIMKTARTGEIGDGKIFVLDVLDSYRIRTGEKGEACCIS